MNNKYIIITCPHCNNKIVIYKKFFNCKIFLHGVYKKNYKQIDPHLNKIQCDQLKKNDLIFGCGKPFKLIKQNDLVNKKDIKTIRDNIV